jgi:hypothetical protein
MRTGLRCKPAAGFFIFSAGVCAAADNFKEKEYIMKNAKKTFGIAVITAAIFSLAGCASSTIKSIDSTEGPAQVGQYKDIDPKDITINATFKDGSQKEAPRWRYTNESITFDNTKVGPQTVSVNLGFGTSATFQTEVVALQSLSGPAPNENHLIRYGYDFDNSLVKLYGTWDKLGKMEIPYELRLERYTGGAQPDPMIERRGYNVYGIDDIIFNKETLGKQTVTFKYKGFETSFEITSVPLSGIVITKPPLAGAAPLGGDLRDLYLIGMVVEGIWEGLPNKELTVSASNVQGYDKNKEGKQTVRYVVGHYSATFELTVQK